MRILRFPNFSQYLYIFMKISTECLIELFLTQAETMEYTDCIYAEEWDPYNDLSRYDYKTSDRKAPVLEI